MTTALNFAQEFPRQCKTWSKQQRVRDHFRTWVRVGARVTHDGKPWSPQFKVLGESR
jgi:hypothetical protein